MRRSFVCSFALFIYIKEKSVFFYLFFQDRRASFHAWEGLKKQKKTAKKTKKRKKKKSFDTKKRLFE